MEKIIIPKAIALEEGPNTDIAIQKGAKAKKAYKKGGTAPADATYLEVSPHQE